MKNLSLKPVLFLGIGVLVAVGGLIQALHEEAFAEPECSVVCVCTNPPCGYPPVENKLCGGPVCGSGATAHNCSEYCQIF